MSVPVGTGPPPVTLALAIGVGLLRDRQVLRDLWLLLPRDMVALGVWVWSYAGNTVTWRGQTFVLKNGQLQQRINPKM